MYGYLHRTILEWARATQNREFEAQFREKQTTLCHGMKNKLFHGWWCDLGGLLEDRYRASLHSCKIESIRQRHTQATTYKTSGHESSRADVTALTKLRRISADPVHLDRHTYELSFIAAAAARECIQAHRSSGSSEARGGAKRDDWGAARANCRGLRWPVWEILPRHEAGVPKLGSLDARSAGMRLQSSDKRRGASAEPA
ncbi:hypothetical protein GGX14DRAFT_399520 [Mycena pura]|uniref:Uncharacterized protein n=1 Tax=Mycena pura TaxID=153505 RepID=A0AAD6V4A5_9AGAR|nr:hypothetical protein GGX14DRAFT_399520 [Mycena pura]